MQYQYKCTSYGCSPYMCTSSGCFPVTNQKSLRDQSINNNYPVPQVKQQINYYNNNYNNSINKGYNVEKRSEYYMSKPTYSTYNLLEREKYYLNK